MTSENKTNLFLYAQTTIFVGILIWITLNWETPKNLSEALQNNHAEQIRQDGQILNELYAANATIEALTESINSTILTVQGTLVSRGKWMREVNDLINEGDRWRLSDQVAYNKQWEAEFKALNPGINLPTITPVEIKNKRIEFPADDPFNKE